MFLSSQLLLQYLKKAVVVTRYSLLKEMDTLSPDTEEVPKLLVLSLYLRDLSLNASKSDERLLVFLPSLILVDFPLLVFFTLTVS